MKENRYMRKVGVLFGVLLFQISIVSAQRSGGDSVVAPRLIHALSIEGQPSFVFPTNDFLKAVGPTYKIHQQGLSGQLKYSFRFRDQSLIDRVYAGVYQGVGVGTYAFGDRYRLGNPVALYLFQGGRVGRLTPRLSVNYEWNFGVSTGWHPYGSDPQNVNPSLGSETNAYMNANLYLNWMISRRVDVVGGVNLTHFSNGNTEIPNAGLNTVGLKVGVAYYFNRPAEALPNFESRVGIPHFPRHVSYDLTLFGSWRKKGVERGNDKIPAPDTYAVAGLNFAAMYNLGYRLRAGASLDAVYDESANIRAADAMSGGYSSSSGFIKPPFSNRFAVGFSGRVEYVMPFFTIGFGLGANAFYAGKELGGMYQILTLKTEITRSSYLHIGYNLQNFRDPNYLMIGIGYRFHNKYPYLHR